MPATEADPAAAPLIHVAVGVITDRQGNVLLALRDPARHQGGLWEFPGGKVEAGEDVVQALKRELQEELGINVTGQYRLGGVRHHYESLSVLLDVFIVDDYTGDPAGLEGQPLRWEQTGALDPAHFPAANRAIIRMLQLPDLIAITGPADSAPMFLERIETLMKRVSAGAEARAEVTARDLMVLLRSPQPQTETTGLMAWPSGSLERYIYPAIELCRSHGVRVGLNAPLEMASVPGLDAYHANSRNLMALTRRPVPESQLFSASCHNLQELQKAQELDADFALLSPVEATASHPDAVPLGWEAFGELVHQLDLPVYALGGVGMEDMVTVRRHGGRGIAGIRWGL